MSIEKLNYLTTKYYNNTASIDEKIEFSSLMKENSQDKYKWHYILQDLLLEKKEIEKEEKRISIIKEINYLSKKWINILKITNKNSIHDLRKVDDIYYPLKNKISDYKKIYNDYPICDYITISLCCGNGRSIYNNLCQKCFGKGFIINIKEV